MEQNNTELATAYAYIDEAGAKGLVRKIVQAKDAEIGLMSALVFSTDMHDEALVKFTPGYERFAKAAPEGAKLHFTDAYTEGNETWAAVANEVRTEFASLFKSMRPIIIYGARRLSLVRSAHENLESLKARAASTSRSDVKITGSNRPSDRRIEDDLILGLSLRLDGFGEVCEHNGIDVRFDLLFDETDKPIAQRYQDAIDASRNVSNSTTSVKGWHPEKGKLSGEIKIVVNSPEVNVNTNFLGKITVIGKNHPLVLAADLVANSLNHHFIGLAASAPLHAPSSIQGWILEECVWGVDKNAFDDLI